VKLFRAEWVAIAGIVSCSDALGGGDDSVPLPDRQLDGSTDAADEESILTGLPPPEGGTKDAAPDGPVYTGCNGALDCERVVFATTKDFGGGFGGVPEADQKCQSHADTSQSPRVKGRKFLAWVSTIANPVAGRFPKGTRPYVLPNGAKVANDWTDLTKGSLQTGIGLNEEGAPPGGSGKVWTGTNNNGSSSNNTCNNWSTNQATGQRGNLGGAGSGWSDSSNDGCGNLGHIYCFEF
jgi:hypothetical protein